MKTINGISDDVMNVVLDRLTEREREAFMLYYGILDGYRYTYCEIGRRFGRCTSVARRLVYDAIYNIRAGLEIIAKEKEKASFDAIYDIKRYDDFLTKAAEDMRLAAKNKKKEIAP